MSAPGIPPTTSISASTLEARILAEWSTIRAFVALHPYITMVIIAVASVLLSHLFWR